MVITAKKDVALSKSQVRSLRQKLLQPPDNPLHAVVLLDASRVLDPELTYSDLCIEYNKRAPCVRDAWIAGVKEAYEEYMATEEDGPIDG